jgi:serine phosphatase RsbU (regulator of sigma subunit)
MKRYLFKALAFVVFALLSLSVQQAFSQDGNPYLTHFKLPSGISNQNWGFEQGENGLMYILNRKGVFSFDGLQWENLGISGRPIAIAFSEKLFFCTDRGIGYLNPTQEGTLEQHLILEASGNNFFYKFNKISNGLLVVSPLTICRINTGGEISIDTLYNETRPEVFISDFFQLNEEMYHVKNRALVYLNKSDGGYEMLTGLPMKEDMVFSFIHGEHAFFGSTANKLYRFDGNKLNPFTIKDQNYINASILNGGKSVNDSTFALSTHNGGLLLVNSKDGSTRNVLNYFNGLTDDEVYSLGMDRDGGLWISHGMGITRADMRLPIKSYNYYPGLKGSILSCIEHNDRIFVGCSEGLFYLAEIRDYKAKDIVVKKKSKPEEKKSEPRIEAQPQVDQTVEEKKKSFISRLFSRQSDDITEGTVDERKTTQVSVSLEEAEIPTVKRRIYELQSVSHSFKQIAGIQGKVRHLIRHSGILYAATNLGLYEVQDEIASRIFPDLNIIFIEVDRLNKDNLLIGTDNGAYIASKRGSRWVLTNLITLENQMVISILGIDNNNFIASTEFDVVFISGLGNGKFQSTVVPVPGTEYGSPVVRWIRGQVKVFTSNRIFDFNPDNKELTVDDSIEMDNTIGVHFFQEGVTWINKKSIWNYLSANEKETFSESQFLSLLDNPNHIYLSDNGEMLIVNAYNQLFRIPPEQSHATERRISLFLKGIIGKHGVKLDPNDIELDYANNSLLIKISAPSYLKEGSIQFQYQISGLTDRWSEWSSDPVLDFPYFPSGNYTISIRAKDILGNTSETISLSFGIKPPFWQTLWFYAICLIVVILLFILTVKLRERNLKREKEILEQKVKERTKTIEEQKEVLKNQRDDLARYNEEILQQKEEIEAQRDEIGIQRDQIFKQNDEITKSITYARRIQSAVMPSKEMIKSLVGNYFLLFRPRDIVSGDFYWMAEKDGKVLVAASDCTGHGVPGAFMSMMGISFLNDIVNVAEVTQPDLILNELRHKIKFNFKQTFSDTETRDGMDIAVCVFDIQAKKVQFAGAYNPMYLVRKGDLTEFKGDKMPVGAHIKEVTFTLHEIDVKSEDCIYIFSDGYVDQFGGEDGKKFMAKPFKELLISVNGKPMPEQQKILEDTLDKWQGANDQVDDILVIGINIE